MSNQANIKSTTKSNMKNKIAIIGSTGLVGSRIVELLSEKYQIEEYNASKGIDITDKSSLATLEKSNAETVIHLAAKADVDGCEKDRSQGKDGEAWKINVGGVKNVAEICEKIEKKLIYISTDFVFDGKKIVGESYDEEDMPAPANWYGQTKYEGEKIVKSLKTPWVIARIAYPYRASFERKKDFVRVIRQRLEEGRVLAGVTDHIMSPTLIDDIARAIDILIEKNASGIYHATGSEALTPFDAVRLIAKFFDLDSSQVEPAVRDDFFTGKAPRPYNLAMKNDKIKTLDVDMKTFEEGLKEIRSQIS